MSAEESSAAADKIAAAESLSLSASQQAKVREQLDRILASALFRNSKRFPEFLRYTVNRALNGDTAGVKERTVGVEAFGRDPNYDTNVDPIVRVTAAAVRKRLAHYYREIGHEHELRIEFARGSYVPEFRFPAEEISASNVPVQACPSPASFTVVPRRNVVLWAVIACLAIPYFIYFGLQFSTTRPSALDDFWAPITNVKAPALVCISVMNPNSNSTGASRNSPFVRAHHFASQPITQLTQLAASTMVDRISFPTSLALSNISAVLGSMNKPFHVRHVNDASLTDLEDGPVVLIGGFDNRWTMDLDAGLRFDLAEDGSVRYVADRRNASSRAWQKSASPNDPNTFTDYAVVSRVRNQTTGRILLTLAGLDRYGTQAAAACVADSSCIAEAEKLQPGDWKTKNIQVVLQTRVIGNAPGEARAVASYLW